MKVTLAKILFPNNEITTEHELYYKGACRLESNSLIISESNNVSFCTYFNSFSACKWNKYTNINNLSLELCFKGDIELNIYDVNEINGNLITALVSNCKFKNRKKGIVSIPISIQAKNILFFDVKSYSNDSILYGGQYVSEIDGSLIKDIKIAVGICTYKREAFINKNLESISKIIENRDSPLFDSLEVFVSDNASTLEPTSNEHIHIFKNPNYGGAGGFSRTMIEAIVANGEKNFSHFIFMDDDVVIDPRVIEKNRNFLSVIKDEYSNHVIGGGMLSVDRMYFQFENAAKWKGRGFEFNLRDIDLRKTENFVLNEKERDVNYNAWCYCCYPFFVIKSNNLPLPIFFHMDDIEYCLRNKMGVITLNGINVWHLYSRAMPPAKNQYYDVRNKLIMIAELNPDGLISYAHDWMNFALMEAFSLHYERALNTYQAIIDYCKGITFLEKKNTLRIHESLHNDSGWRNATSADKELAHVSLTDTQKDFALKKSLFKSALLRKKSGSNVIYTCNSALDAKGFKKVTVFDLYGNRSKDFKFSFIQLARTLLKRLHAKYMINKHFLKATKSYHENINELQSFEFWNRYLGLNYAHSGSINVCFCSSDNNVSSGAFNSMVVLASLLRDRYNINPIIILPCDGNGQTLLREYDLPYILVETEDWIVKEGSDKCCRDLKIDTACRAAKKAYKQFKNIFKKYNIDIVHINTSYHFASALPAFDNNIKVVWHIREFLEEDQSRTFANKEFSISLMNKANRVIGISSSICDKYSSVLKNITKVYNGIDFKKYYKPNRSILNHDRINFLCVGVIDEYKGQHYLVNALVNLYQKGFKNFFVTLVGADKGYFANALKNKIDEAGLNKHFDFCGVKTDVYNYYEKSDIVFVGSKAEAFGRITVEGMMAGCLIIGSNTYGTKEIVDNESGFLFNLDNPAELEKIILEVGENRDNARRMAKCGQEKACKYFSAERNADNVFDIYKKVMAE